MNATQIIAYYRVSTRMQGIQGLGMQAQRTAVAAYAAQNGVPIIASYEEVESARREHLRNRPQLLRALAHARRSGAVLVIARLDRLARSVFVTSQLLSSGVEFIACDNPHANRMTVQIIAVMAEQESRLVSERCKAALAAAKARGVVFGNKGRYVAPEDARRWGIASGLSHRANTREAYADLLPMILDLRASGLSLKAIADELNARGHCNRRKLPLTKYVVAGILERSGFHRLLARIPGSGYPSPETQAKAALAAAAARRERSHQAYGGVLIIAARLRRAKRSYAAIARRLSAAGLRLTTGRDWTGPSVSRLLKREKFLEDPAVSKALGQIAGAKASAAISKQIRAKLAPMRRQVLKMRSAGHSWRAVATWANDAGFTTRWNTAWTIASMYMFIKRGTLRQMPR